MKNEEKNANFQNDLKPHHMEQHMPSFSEESVKESGEAFPVDFEELKRSNILISGTNSTGKTLSACSIADEAMKKGWQVIVFDNAGKFKRSSNLPYFIGVGELSKPKLIGETSIIFDLSTMTPDNQREWIEVALKQLWDERINSNPQKWTLLIFEEFHLVAKTVRGDASQQLLRMMSVGRNVKVRCLGITVDLALTDAAFIRLCGQRYHFRLGIEENGKRKYKSYYGKDAVYEATHFDCGFCHYLHPSYERVKIVKVPEFKSEKKPRNLERKPEKKKGFVKKLWEILTFPAQGISENKHEIEYSVPEADFDEEDDENEEEDGALFF